LSLYQVILQRFNLTTVPYGECIGQGWATSVLEGHCPTEFSFNTIQTHLNKIIEVFRITRKLQAGDFFRVGAIAAFQAGF